MARALSAFLAGDLHASRHLAYYAQLRAGLSILGHLGIGIFNGINFAVDYGGRIIQLDDPRLDQGMGTHGAVWEALKLWVQDPAAARRFLSCVHIAGSSLAICLDAIWPGAAANAIAMPLISAWGLDLLRGREEHRARNISSYNPQVLWPMHDDVIERLYFIEVIWDLFEPTSIYRFDMLDRFLLRSLLWHQHDVVSGSGVSKADGAIGRRYDDLPPLVRKIASRDFLTGIREPGDPSLLQKARSNTSPAHADEMIARGLLLLRAATAFTIANFKDAGIQLGSGKLRPWIDPLAAARGFWSPASPLSDPADLWEDVKIARQELAKSVPPKPASLNDWLKNASIGLPAVTEVERISVWSLGI